jgi:hypothetical protein
LSRTTVAMTTASTGQPVRPSIIHAASAIAMAPNRR